MSNRNPQPSKAQSKSPQPQRFRQIDKELMKQLILSKLMQPNLPKQVKTLPDELDDDPMDFKQEIERRLSILMHSRYQKCQANKSYIFNLESYSEDDLSDCDSLQGVTTYNLHAQNHQGGYAYAEEVEDLNLEKLTDATQQEFVKQVNRKLMDYLKDMEDDYEPAQIVRTEGDEVRLNDYKVKQYNYVKKAPTQEKPRQVRVQLGDQSAQNHSDTSIIFENRLKIQSIGRDSSSGQYQNKVKIPPREPLLLSQSRNQPIEHSSGSKQNSYSKSRKEPDPDKQILMKHFMKTNNLPKDKDNSFNKLGARPQQIGGSFYVKKTQPPQINNNFVNISMNINNSMIITRPQQKKPLDNGSHIRVKTEPFYEDEEMYQQFKVTSKPTKPIRKAAPVGGNKKIILDPNRKINYTMDQKLLEQIEKNIMRNSKSQNKNYQP